MGVTMMRDEELIIDRSNPVIELSDRTSAKYGVE
jgi:hypothetical protein